MPWRRQIFQVNELHPHIIGLSSSRIFGSSMI